MTRGGRDGLSPGDIGDPVADNLRSEMNRDAAPSKDEIARMKAKDEQCEECLETKPDVERRSLVMADCPAMQVPDRPFRLLCDECDEERPSLEEKAVDHARKRDKTDRLPDVDFVVLYSCGRSHKTRREEADIISSGPGPRANAPVECECGAMIEKVIPLEDD